MVRNRPVSLARGRLAKRGAVCESSGRTHSNQRSRVKEELANTRENIGVEKVTFRHIMRTRWR